MSHNAESDVGPCCPFCLSTDPNKVGVEKATGKVCRDPFHCPVPESHSNHGGVFRICAYCEYREDPLAEPPAGWAVGWVNTPADGGPMIEPTPSFDALAILAEHQPIKTYDGPLGIVIDCPICGEGAGASELDALRRHDVAVLVARIFPPAETEAQS